MSVQWCELCTIQINQAQNAAGELCPGCIWRQKVEEPRKKLEAEKQQIQMSKRGLEIEIARLRIDLKKQVETNAVLIGYHAEELKRRIEAEKQLEELKAQKHANEKTEAMEVEETKKSSSTCVYIVGEEILEHLKTEKHLAGLLGKNCLLRTKNQLVQKQFELAEKLIRGGTADEMHLLMYIGWYNLRDENFRSWKVDELGKEIIAGLEKLRKTEKVLSITWTNLPETGDLAQPITELNKIVEEWVTAQDDDEVNLLNLRGIYQNRTLFHDGRLSKAGAIEMTKKIVSWYADTLTLDEKEEENLRSKMKRIKMLLDCEKEKAAAKNPGRGWPPGPSTSRGRGARGGNATRGVRAFARGVQRSSPYPSRGRGLQSWNLIE